MKSLIVCCLIPTMAYAILTCPQRKVQNMRNAEVTETDIRTTLEQMNEKSCYMKAEGSKCTDEIVNRFYERVVRQDATGSDAGAAGNVAVDHGEGKLSLKAGVTNYNGDKDSGAHGDVEAFVWNGKADGAVEVWEAQTNASSKEHLTESGTFTCSSSETFVLGSEGKSESYQCTDAKQAIYTSASGATLQVVGGSPNNWIIAQGCTPSGSGAGRLDYYLFPTPACNADPGCFQNGAATMACYMQDQPSACTFNPTSRGSC